MQTVKRKDFGRGPEAAGVGLLLFGVFKLNQAYRTPVDSSSAAFAWAHYGAYLDGILWLVIGASLLLISLKSKNLPVLEYDEESARLIKPRALGAPQKLVIPISDITRFQASEPTVVDIYFMKNGDETIENLIGNADDIAQFKAYVESRKR